MVKKAILVVSFGSSYQETREKTIDLIEKEIAEAFPSVSIYNAYTSKVILKILKEKDKLDVNSIKEAFEKMYSDGIEEVYVQPTFVANSTEFCKMKQEIESYDSKFKKVKIGDVLLSSQDDYLTVINAFLSDIPKLKNQEAIVLMGHGSDKSDNSIYIDLDSMFKSCSSENIFVATIKGHPHLQDITVTLKEQDYLKLYLIPFMIVAGGHAKKDMSSDDEASWKVILEKMGFEVECILKGLGENANIRKVFIEHVKDIIE